MNYSVLVPAYNCEKTIAYTVDSIQKSGLTDFEILIIDDGSTDQTLPVLRQIAARYPNIVLLTKPNGGVSTARNLGLEKASGEYLIFVDADDILAPDCYVRAVEKIALEKPDILMFGMRFEHYYRGVCYQQEDLVCSFEAKLSSVELSSHLSELFRCNYLSPIWNKIIRREIVVQNHLRFSEEMFLLEDCKFSLDCLRYCESVLLLPEVVYRYQLLDDGKKARARVRHLPSLSTYMVHFSDLPMAFSGIIRDIYWMLLSQRISFATTKNQLKLETEDFRQSPFYDEKPAVSVAVRQLQEGRFIRILIQNIKSRIRHRFVVLYKTAKHFVHRH